MGLLSIVKGGRVDARAAKIGASGQAAVDAAEQRARDARTNAQDVRRRISLLDGQLIPAALAEVDRLSKRPGTTLADADAARAKASELEREADLLRAQERGFGELEAKANSAVTDIKQTRATALVAAGLVTLDAEFAEEICDLADRLAGLAAVYGDLHPAVVAKNPDARPILRSEIDGMLCQVARSLRSPEWATLVAEQRRLAQLPQYKRFIEG